MAEPTEWDRGARPDPDDPRHAPAQASPAAGRRRGRSGARAAGSVTATATSALHRPGGQDHRQERRRCSASSSRCPKGGGRLVPVDKNRANGSGCSPRRRGRREGRRSRRRSTIVKHGRWACRTRKVRERLGSEVGEGRQPHRDPRSRHPERFPAPDRRGRGSEAGALDGREDWRDLPLVTIDPADAKDHDDAVLMPLPDDDPQRRAASWSRSRSPTWRPMCAPARPSTARRWSAATRSTSPTGSCPCCRSGSPTISAPCAREDRPALAVRMVIGADGPQEAPRLPPGHDALGRSSPTSRPRPPSTAARRGRRPRSSTRS